MFKKLLMIFVYIFAAIGVLAVTKGFTGYVKVDASLKKTTQAAQ